MNTTSFLASCSLPPHAYPHHSLFPSFSLCSSHTELLACFQMFRNIVTDDPLSLLFSMSRTFSQMFMACPQAPSALCSNSTCSLMTVQTTFFKAEPLQQSQLLLYLYLHRACQHILYYIDLVVHFTVCISLYNLNSLRAGFGLFMLPAGFSVPRQCLANCRHSISVSYRVSGSSPMHSFFFFLICLYPELAFKSKQRKRGSS